MDSGPGMRLGLWISLLHHTTKGLLATSHLMAYYASHMVETRPDLFRGNRNGTKGQA